MTVDIDLNFLPFHRIAGKDWPTLPGLQTVAPPRRAARGREGDHLFIYLTLAGNKPFSSDEYTKIITQMTGSFYETAGSLTAALRTTADMLNQTLLNRNLSTTGQGHYIVGRLILGVLRASQLMVVQSGPTHIFCVGKNDVQHLHDPDLSGRGLGFTQTTTLYYSQLDLAPGDQLVISAQLPNGWDAALMSERGATSIKALYRKLQSIPNENINAAIIEVQAGKGLLNLFSAERQSPLAAPQEAPQETPVSAPAPVPDVESDLDGFPSQEDQSNQRFEPRLEPIVSAPEEFENSTVSEAVDQTAASVQEKPSRFSQLLKGSSLKEKPIIEHQYEAEPDGSIGVAPEFRELGQSEIFNTNQTTELPEIKRPDSS
ncbi:MAG: hypothetical protein E4H33_04790, partial [Anaerolineales bacterium]